MCIRDSVDAAVGGEHQADVDLTGLDRLLGQRTSRVQGFEAGELQPVGALQPRLAERPGLQGTYGLKFAGFKSLDSGGPLTKQAIKTGQVDIGLVFSSDGGIDALGLQVLTDDKKLQTADNIVPIVRKDKAKDPLTGALNKE